jgi:hypothetical protein
MNPEMRLFCLKALAKFGLLGLSAIVTLLIWKRRHVESKNLYQASWANPVGYLLWLAAVTIMVVLNKSSAFGWMVSGSLPASLFFFLPFLFMFGSLCLCLLCFGAKREERRFPLMSNALMLILWASSVTAPN